MITEARVEIATRRGKRWISPSSPRSIPAAVELGRSVRADELRRMSPPRAVRVVDSAGAVVAQWGTP